MIEYQMRRTPRREIRRVRGLAIHLTRWGPEPTAATPAVLMLHGWQDTGDTFQFMVDAFQEDWPLLAADWRGFGRSEVPQDGYWFPDYMADLDALLDQLSPAAPVRIVAHSMGANVASLYSGLRPGRVRCLVNLEGFGVARTMPSGAAVKMRKWLDQLKAPPVLKNYASLEQLAALIALRYPRFSQAQATFIARAWSEPRSDGRIHLLGDSRHRLESPLLYKREDAEAIWQNIEAPNLLVLARQSAYLPLLGADGSDEALRRVFPGSEIVHVEDAGHMLHIEKAEVVALLAENFLRAH